MTPQDLALLAALLLKYEITDLQEFLPKVGLPWHLDPDTGWWYRYNLVGKVLIGPVRKPWKRKEYDDKCRANDCFLIDHPGFEI